MNELFTSLIDAIKASTKELYAYANDARRMYVEGRKRLGEARDKFADAKAGLDEFIDQMCDVSEVFGRETEIIKDALFDADMCPTVDFDQFVGFCDECGKEIAVNDYFEADGDLLLCEDCVEEPEIESEDEDEDVVCEEYLEDEDAAETDESDDGENA